MSPAVQNLATVALNLEEKSRAELASVLLRSLDQPLLLDEDTERLWLEEANRRDQELTSGSVEDRPWKDVLAAAQDRLG